MFCPKCDQEIPEHSAFCPKCGQRVNQNSSISPNQRTEKSNIAGTENSPFGGNPLYPKIALGAAAVVVVALVIVLLVSGTGGSGKSSVARNGASTGPAVNNNQATDAVQNQEDQAKAKLAEADSAFSSGDYDTALRLYRDIDTDYAKTRVRAIECIPIADAVAKEWLEATDNEANEIVMAAFDLNFTFDTEYDPQTYTFYTKMYYPALYTSLVGAFVSRETIEGGVTSSGHEKTAYEMFCKRGYEDITCVSNMYDSDGGLLVSFPYNKEIREAEIVREQQEAAAAAAKEAQAAAEREAVRDEFIAGLNSNEEFWSAVDKELKKFESKQKLNRMIDQYWKDHKDQWQYDSLSAFEITKMEYGEAYVLDSEREAEGARYIGESYTIGSTATIIHLPCTAEAFARIYGLDAEVIFNAELELVFEANPLIVRCTYLAKQDAITVKSMEENEAYAPVIENPLDVPYPWVGMDMYSFAEQNWGGIGETLSSDWFNFTVENVYAAHEYSGVNASEGNQLIVADVLIDNISSHQIIFDDTDLKIYWEKGESSCGALQTIAGAILDIGETCSGTLVYEVPEQIQNFAIILCDGEPVYPKASIIGFSVGE